jgi:hypothetical protein
MKTRLLKPTLSDAQKFDAARGTTKRQAWGALQIKAQERKNKNSPRPSLAPLPRRSR